MAKHFTVSIYIVHDHKVLLHHHKRAKILLPVGGHIEPNELPEAAALREAFEETGLSITLYGSDPLKALDTEREKALMNPIHMVWAEIEKGHEHMDFVFYAQSNSAQLNPDESLALKWYTANELEAIQASLLKDVYFMALEALKLYEEP